MSEIITFNNIIVVIIFIIINCGWIYAARKQNGTFDKGEAVILMLLNMAAYQGLIMHDNIGYSASLATIVAHVWVSKKPKDSLK